MVITFHKINFVRNKNVILSFVYLLLFLSALTGTVAQAANITVTSSRNPVALDDSFHLIYEAESSVDDDPEFSPVYKDFDVLSSSQSTNMRSINGNWSLKKSWDLTVMAKNTGKFTIPSINFGTDISPAIMLTVTSSSSPDSVSPDGKASVPAKIFLESSIDKKSGWVQSQFVYSVRLMRTVSIAGAALSDPTTSDTDAIIQKLSEDNYQTTRNGIRYEVFERRYAIFPQNSGTLKIDPLTFEGRVNVTQSRTIFDQFRMSGQLKRLRSKAIEIKVKAAPANINLQDWLPATDLQLIEEWSADVQNIKAGEPVTRTIVIAAEGLTGAQLPDLIFDDIKDLKQYPDKAVIEDRKSTTGITGLKQIKIALIPASAGSYTLPAIELKWWNTKTNKQQTATLPQTVITVTGVANTTIDSTPAPAQNMSPIKEQPIADTKVPAPTMISDEPYWRWLSLFFALAWLVTLTLLFKKPGSAKNKINKDISSPSLKSAASEVLKQAKKNDAKKTKNALIQWAKIFYKDKSLTNLAQLSDYCSAELDEQLRQLNQTLYSPEKPDWNSKDLLIAFKNEQLLNNKNKGKQTSALKPLYNN
jgi:hypothetical protein